MADKFVNGLYLTAPTSSQCGRTFSRWFVEWLTQVCGWTVIDNVSGNWTNYVGQGTAGATVTSYPQRFSITTDSYTFTSSDIGSYLTITGFVDRWLGRNGIYRIVGVISSKIVEIDIARGVHEDGLPSDITGLTWKLWKADASYVPTSTNVIVLGGTGTYGGGYTFHLHITVRATNSYFPEFRMSPFASWNAGTHSWSNSKYTSAVGIDNWNNSLLNTDSIRIWASADSDRVALMVRVEDDQYAWHFVYAGEIDVLDGYIDTKPCVLWSGSNRGNATVGDDNATLFGYGADSSMYSGGRWLAADELTTVTGYGMIAHISPSSDVNWISDSQRRFSEFSRERYRQPIICESRTTGQMELRGTLRRVWITARDEARLIPYGYNGEFLHILGGVSIPWNNSKVWYERG